MSIYHHHNLTRADLIRGQLVSGVQLQRLNPDQIPCKGFSTLWSMLIVPLFVFPEFFFLQSTS